MINGLPAHPMLVHFLVVLTPLTAVLLILCVLWPAARQRLTWLALALAAMTLVLTPLATEAGEWLYKKVDGTEALETHEHLGKTMIYVSVALLVAALLVTVAHLRAGRGKPLPTVVAAVIAVLVIGVGVGASVQIFRIGHSGAESVWGDVLQPAAAEGGTGG